MTEAEIATLESLANSLDKLNAHIRFFSETLRAVAASNDNVKDISKVANK